jgi:FlaA1/EpsC-like NDP-sugar epimerase
VFGAGEGGELVIRALLRDPASRYRPVAVLDDDPGRHGQQLEGVPVVGDRQAIPTAAARYGARLLLHAVPSSDAALVRDVVLIAESAGLEARVLPSERELVDGMVRLGDIREPTDADLLGRRQIETDLVAIADYLAGRRVLVTGAGGSIGSELCRQISGYEPASLVMLDRDESALHALQLSLNGRALLDSPDVVLADIRDPAALRRTFAEQRPEVVFHAAALKHLPLLERFPVEAVKTNVLGTLNVLQAAANCDVERFVNISTDKAADPSSVLGLSKRVSEMLTAHVAGDAAGTFLSVRFGNVLGSRGSVLTAFRAQIAAGGPVTVTHPDVTRYFMTITEAVELVIQAGAIGRDGEALVLDMGEPVAIAEVAQRLIESADWPIEIVFTGLRPGEKLHEALLGAEEHGQRLVHPLISHVTVPAVGPDTLTGLLGEPPSALARALMERLCEARGVQLSQHPAT